MKLKTNGKDEWWGIIYTCPECDTDSIWDDFKFCPMCGISLKEYKED